MWEQYLPTTPTDIGLVAIVIFSALFALYRGFVREFLAILAWAGAFFVTIYGFTLTYKFFHGFIENEMVAHGLSAALLFLISLIVFSLLAHMVASWIRKTPLSSLDRFLGLLFGALRGMLVICLLYITLIWFYKDKELPVWVTNAKMLPLIQKGTNYLTELVPEAERIKLIKMFQEFISDKSEKEEENFLRNNEATSGAPVHHAPLIKQRSDQMPEKDVVLHPYSKKENVTTQDNVTPAKKVTSGSLDDPIHSGKPKPATPKDAAENLNTNNPAGYDSSSRSEMDQLVEKSQ